METRSILKYIFGLSCLLLIGILLAFRKQAHIIENTGEIGVSELLVRLGDEKPKHWVEWDEKKSKIGEDLVKKGRTRKGIFRSKLISPYFVCTDCHSLEPEVEYLNEDTPEKRLDFAIAKNRPFYSASPLYGVYNRTSWYNGDYEKKYGDIIDKAKGDLREAVQVCSKYCSAGRLLEAWEEDAILHYLKKIEIKFSDLHLPNERISPEFIVSASDTEKKQLIERIKGAYPHFYEATFLPTMDVKDRKMGAEGNSQRGEQLFEKSCMHCHFQGRVTHLKLAKDKLTAKEFWEHRSDYSQHSLYQIVRQGTYTRAGRNQYMPLFTKERMSNQQIEDLMAYLKKLSGNE